MEAKVYSDFNPPSPCGEGRYSVGSARQLLKFQSTLPVRGGTFADNAGNLLDADFNPPSPCGEGQI